MKSFEDFLAVASQGIRVVRITAYLSQKLIYQYEFRGLKTATLGIVLGVNKARKAKFRGLGKVSRDQYLEYSWDLFGC